MLKLLEVWLKSVFVNIERSLKTRDEYWYPPEIFQGWDLVVICSVAFLVSLMVKGILSGT